jgi:hypothetical protein
MQAEILAAVAAGRELQADWLQEAGGGRGTPRFVAPSGAEAKRET